MDPDRRRPRLAAAGPADAAGPPGPRHHPLPARRDRAPAVRPLVRRRLVGADRRRCPGRPRDAALPHDQLPDHRLPGRGAARVPEQARPLRVARPGPHRRPHGVPDPSGAGVGHAAHRHRSERDEERGAPGAGRDRGSRRREAARAAAPPRTGDGRRRCRPAHAATRRSHPRPRVGSVRAVDLDRDRHRRSRPGRARPEHPHVRDLRLDRPRQVRPPRPRAARDPRRRRPSWSRSVSSRWSATC